MVNRRTFARRARFARKALALALTFFLTHGFAAGLFPAARAQSAPAQGGGTQAVTSPGKYPLDAGSALVIYKDESGTTVCRAADEAETRRILDRGGDTHLIYAGAPTTRTDDGRIVASPFAAATADETEALALAPSAGLHIFLHGTTQLEQNQTAKNAFIVAANRWEARISTPVNVVIDVDYGTQFFGKDFPDEDILGQTGAAESVSRIADVRQRLLDNSPTAAEQALYNALPTNALTTELNGSAFNSTTVRMTVPNARALGLVNDIANPASIPLKGGDALIGFNSAFGFDFNPDDGITANLTDFDAVATHEIGHALGFTSESGGPVYAAVSMWDLFRFRPGAANASNFGSAPRIMSAGGSQVYFNGQTNTFGSQELALSTGGPEGFAGDGNQSSHWKADEQTAPRRYIGIMDPTIADGQREVITDNDVKALDSFGYSLAGNSVAHPAPPPPSPTGPPANDNFSNAVVLTGVSGTVTGDNTGATKQSGEPVNPEDSGGRSVWYAWTAPTSGTAVVDTEGSAFDTILAVYTGSTVGGLTFVASNDDIDTGVFINSKVTFPVTAGITYRICVDGFVNVSARGADYGLIQLNWSGPPAGTIQLASAVNNVSEYGSAVNVAVLRTGDTSQTQSVSYATANGTALAGSDYTAATGTVTFGPGETLKLITVLITDDSVIEPDETFSVSISNPTGGAALGATTTTVVTILNDDVPQPPSVQFTAADVTVAESAGSVTLTVTRTGDSPVITNVSYGTSDGTATAFDPDYTARSDNFTFDPGQTSRQITIPINNDTKPEPSETFTVRLTGVTSGSVIGGVSTVTVTITDDDPVRVNSVQFSTGEVTVSEDIGVATVTVTRTGDTAGEASVGYTTLNGTADDRHDYLMSVGTLHFAPGETSKTITVFVVNDVYGNGNTGGVGDEAAEYFVVDLTSSALADIGATRRVRVNIANDETVDGVNPVRDASVVPSFFARQHYFDFLNRVPDQSGLDFWTGQTTGCGNPDLLVCRINVSAAFFLSGEFQETGGFVIRAQRVAFGRKSAEQSSRMNYVAFMRDARQVGEGYVDGQPGAPAVLEANKQAYAVQVVTSPEFGARNWQPYDSLFVDQLYASAGVVPTQAERVAAVTVYNSVGPNQLAQRVAAFRYVVDSASVRNAEFRGAFVLMEYFGYMRRDPDEVGYQFWLGKLNEFGGNYVAAELVKAFITSGEYQERFGP